MSRIRPLYDNCLVSCVIAADTHIDIKHSQPWLPQLLLKRALSDSTKARATQDAFIIVGDTTSRGDDVNWGLTEDCFKKYPAPAKEIFLPLGNHDTWNDEGYDSAIDCWRRAVKKICGKSPEKQYFSAEIGGFRFIFMGSVGDVGDMPVLGDEQLGWLDSELAAGTKDGKPVFVFNHQSLNGRHGLPQTAEANPPADVDPAEGGVGAESDALEAILKKYQNVFYFSGHSHMGFCGEKFLREKGFSSIEEEGGVVLFNLPSNACGNHSGENNRNCVGLVLEIYKDKVVVRLRDFLKHTWFKKVPVQNGNPYFEKKIR